MIARLVLVVFTAMLIVLPIRPVPAQSAVPTQPVITASTIPAWAASQEWQPCLNDEDAGPRCVWDARHNGDGRGTSYIYTRTGRVLIVTHRVAHWLLLPTYAA